LKSIYTAHIAIKMDVRTYNVYAVPLESVDAYIKFLKTHLIKNILLILADYNTHFNTYDELTLQTIRTNDREYNRVVQHLLVMAGITCYGLKEFRFTIADPVERSKPIQAIYKKWLDLTERATFKRRIKNYWNKYAEAKQSARTAPVGKFFPDISDKTLAGLHSIFRDKKGGGKKGGGKKGGPSDENSFPLGSAANGWIKGTKPAKKSSDKKKLIRANVEERKSIVWENANMQFVLRI
jgi:hypothetical protein